MQNLLYFRFANSFLEPLWNRDYVEQRADHDGRALRRRGPRHASTRRPARSATSSRTTCCRSSRCLAMDAPVGQRRRGDPRREGARAARRSRRSTPAHVVRGQFRGYRDEPGVAPDSTVETFAAVRLHIDTWRWAGVPFFIRAGKCLPVTLHRGARRSSSRRRATSSARRRSRVPELPALPPRPGRRDRARRARRSVPGEADGRPRGRADRRRAAPAIEHDAVRAPARRRDARRRDPVRARGRRSRRSGASSSRSSADVTPLHDYEPGTWGPPQAERSHRAWTRPG